MDRMPQFQTEKEAQSGRESAEDAIRIYSSVRRRDPVHRLDPRSGAPGGYAQCGQSGQVHPGAEAGAAGIL